MFDYKRVIQVCELFKTKPDGDFWMVVEYEEAGIYKRMWVAYLLSFLSFAPFKLGEFLSGPWRWGRRDWSHRNMYTCSSVLVYLWKYINKPFSLSMKIYT